MRLSLCLIATVLSIGTIHAQQLQEQPKKPGDVIKFEVKLSGPDADKILAVSLNFGMPANTNQNQQGFSRQLSGTAQTSNPPGTFVVEVKVGNDNASGTYKLTQAGAGERDIAANYAATELPDITIRVENPRTFMKPNITIKQLP